MSSKNNIKYHIKRQIASLENCFSFKARQEPETNNNFSVFPFFRFSYIFPGICLCGFASGYAFTVAAKSKS